MADVLPEEGMTILVNSDTTRWLVRHVGPEAVLLLGEEHVNYVAAGRHKVKDLDSLTQVRVIGRWLFEDDYVWTLAP